MAGVTLPGDGDQPFRSVPGLLPASSAAFPRSAPGASDKRLVLTLPGGRTEAQERLRNEGSSWCSCGVPDLPESGVPTATPVMGNPRQLSSGNDSH